MKTITIIGSGYVGVSTAALAANAGYKVYLVDVNPKRIDVIKQGRSFFFEEGIDPLIKKAVDACLLIPTLEYEPAISESSVIFSCVGTPDNPDGSPNLEYIYASAAKTAETIRPGSVYVQKSTVPVGTGAKVSQLLPKDVSYVSNPEFLREACAVRDSIMFDRIVVGGDNRQAIEKVFEIYKAIEKNGMQIARLAKIDLPTSAKSGKYMSTTLESAELIKVTANAFLALKISFANSIAKLADASGADVVGVMDGIGEDMRIGRAFLNAGRGYGGGCFPKDVSGLISSASDYGVELPIMVSAQDTNESMPGYIVEKAHEKLGSSLKDLRVAVLGLAFKAGTSDARKSQAVKIANLMDKAGAKIVAYDPQAAEEAKEELRRNVVTETNIEAALKGVQVIFLATEWPEIIQFDYVGFTDKNSSVKLVVDCMNCLPEDVIKRLGNKYVGVGR
ncbi:UDP-glucose/GDP-mannose dehydrogenase family protein [Candidatus Saccharibacteria bacterium]|nr:UDP-glucose/GDP-mannose dehydrogenase family protein [Candidatus Saccharibacteria bacterium]